MCFETIIPFSCEILGDFDFIFPSLCQDSSSSLFIKEASQMKPSFFSFMKCLLSLARNPPPCHQRPQSRKNHLLLLMWSQWFTPHSLHLLLRSNSESRNENAESSTLPLFRLQGIVHMNPERIHVNLQDGGSLFLADPPLNHT